MVWQGLDLQWYTRIISTNGRIMFDGEGSGRRRNAINRITDFRKKHLSAKNKYHFIIQDRFGVIQDQTVI